MRPFFWFKNMNTQEVNEKLKSLTDWSYDESTLSLVKTFQFKSYLKNIAFVNAVAWIANKENHHPDLEVSFNRCIVKLTTHDAGGVSEKDFEMAKGVDAL
jgi:4a-hydroxytetrahydrobiopterin dehydratase